MAYSLSGLQQIGPGGKGPRLWMYSTTDAIAAMNSEGYFNNASDLLQVRDTIIAVDSNTPTNHLVIVLSNASGVVDVSDGLAITETDSD
ncbi:MAG: hypothetical protein CMI60_21115 [Parvibaculum sp.]|nr:hypothetical protein [Parvibaculum sp.]|tara:strand:- start:269 stop:535 length:267 start_codon:yes stop_codon:yes gene_type:complete